MRLTYEDALKRVKKEGLDVGIFNTYRFALENGFPTFYFPDEYIIEIRDEVDVKNWLSLWPSQKDIYTQTGHHLDYAINGSYPECVKRMKQFLKSWKQRGLPDGDREEIIFEATIRYLDKLKEKNYEFAKKNFKFILDSNGSKLADEILNNFESNRKFQI